MDKIEVTQADIDCAEQVQACHSHIFAAGIIARHRILTTRTDATPVAEASAGMEAAMQDPDYAWGWHCNLAMPIMDATGITHEQANMAAAHLMQHLWKCDITTHPHYQYEKSGAQAYAEFRIEADKAEDAALPVATDVAALVEHFRRMIEACANYVEPTTYIARHPTGELCKWNTEFPEPRKHQSIDGALATTRRRDQAFISDMIYMLDGPEQRAALAPFTKGQNDE